MPPMTAIDSFLYDRFFPSLRSNNIDMQSDIMYSVIETEILLYVNGMTPNERRNAFMQLGGIEDDDEAIYHLLIRQWSINITNGTIPIDTLYRNWIQ